LTQEVLSVKKGKILLDIDAPESREYFKSQVLCTDELALLAHGGHSFTILKQPRIVEVKQVHTRVSSLAPFCQVANIEVVFIKE
jgi:hypothetical protein